MMPSKVEEGQRSNLRPNGMAGEKLLISQPKVNSLDSER